MTAAELIAVLKTLPKDTPVKLVLSQVTDWPGEGQVLIAKDIDTVRMCTPPGACDD